MNSDLLNQDTIQIIAPNLACVQVHESLASTNSTLRELLEQGAGHGTLVVADSQTQGRGRYGRYFHSPKGSGIYMSLLLEKERLGLTDASLLTIFAGACTCRALRLLTGKPVEIKWINDLFLQGKKVGGILAEAVDDYFILGIGINVRPSAEAFPVEIGEFVDFLYGASEASVSRNEIIAKIASNLLDGSCQSGLIAEYKRYSAVLGKKVSVTAGKSVYEADALDIDEQGRLLVRKLDLSVERLCSGEVRIKL